MEILFGLFMLTGAYLWLLVAGWVILELAAMEYENGGLAFLWLFLVILLLHMGGVINIIVLLFSSPLITLITILGYFAIGTLWAMLKFKVYLMKKRIEVNERLATRTALGRDFVAVYEENFSVRANKMHIMRWATWWPFSMVWTIVRDFVRDVFEWIVTDILGKAFKSIAASEYAKVKKFD